jgi:hypothetical protein
LIAAYTDANFFKIVGGGVSLYNFAIEPCSVCAKNKKDKIVASTYSSDAVNN